MKKIITALCLTLAASSSFASVATAGYLDNNTGKTLLVSHQTCWMEVAFENDKPRWTGTEVCEAPSTATINSNDSLFVSSNKVTSPEVDDITIYVEYALDQAGDLQGLRHPEHCKVNVHHPRAVFTEVDGKIQCQSLK